jgi:CBS domain containing-hemolysin-like protein
VSARGIATVGAVNAALDRPALPGDDAETVAGLLVDTLGRPPDPGERVAFDDALVIVEAIEDNRVRKVVVERRGDEGGGGGDATDDGGRGGRDAGSAAPDADE